MFCFKCGKGLPSDSIFCPYCGVNVNIEGSAELSGRPESVDYDSFEPDPFPDDQWNMNTGVSFEKTMGIISQIHADEAVKRRNTSNNSVNYRTTSASKTGVAKQKKFSKTIIAILILTVILLASLIYGINQKSRIQALEKRIEDYKTVVADLQEENSKLRNKKGFFG